MQVHILAGDCLAGDLRQMSLEGELIVTPECLIEGPVEAEPLEKFWKARAKYLEERYSEPGKYFAEAVPRFEKMLALPDDAEISLWFEYDLFCQANMWFILSLLRPKQANIYRVFPSVRTDEDKWRGFGSLSSDELNKCFETQVKLTPEDVELGANLWNAYKREDLAGLEALSNARSNAFPYLKEVCIAEIERKRDHRPQNTLQRIAKKGVTEFGKIFEQFVLEDGVYGFGDLQVKAMYEGLKI
jgi:hypothetical protein